MRHPSRHPFRVLILSSLLFFASCADNATVCEATFTLPAAGWQRFEPRELQASIPDADECYELLVTALVDTTRYREPSLPVILKITSPQGETRTLTASVPFRGKEGHTLGEPGPRGQARYTQRIREYFYFNHPGIHTVSIGQRTSHYEIKGIEQITFTVRKARLEYPK